MKRVNNLYEKLISDENLQLALAEVNASHRWLPKHRPNKIVAWVEQDMEQRVKDLRAFIQSDYEPSDFRERRRWDKSAGKWRDICEPKLWPDQYLHHALIQVLEPVMMRGMDPFCCGSIRQRGIHYGMKAIKKWMGNDIKGTKYCLELDIRHFYDTLQPSVVMNRLRSLVKDNRVLSLVERVLTKGVQIGVYCSQWFANTALQPLDHLIREGGFGATHYLRYMDNFTIFGSNKRKLHKLFLAIQTWLNSRDLEVKGNWQLFPTASRLPTALGYRFGKGYTLLRKRNLLRLKRQLARYYKKGRKRKVVSNRMATGLLSRLGQLNHCNNKGIYRRHYKSKTQKNLKAIVRAYSRKERLKWNTFLAETTSLA